MKVSVIRNLNEVVENISLSAVLEQIQDGSHSEKINNLRKHFQDGDTVKYKQLKKSLPAFTPSGTFISPRNSKNILSYNSCIILDIDNIAETIFQSVFNAIIECSYTYACFRSPSNHGLKVIVVTDGTVHFHSHNFSQVKKLFENLLGLSIDASCSDISRMCFFSWDENLFINNNYQTLKTEKTQTVNKISNTKQFFAPVLFPEKIFELYLQKLEWFSNFFIPETNKDLIIKVFDSWFHATYIHKNKSGRLIWKT